MTLYHAISSHQLLLVITHKISYHNDEASVLIISTDVYPRLTSKKNLLKYFSNVIEYDNGMGNLEVIQQGSCDTYFKLLLKKNKIELDLFNMIYVACAHHSFGIFLAQSNIPFIFIEDGVGALSKPEVLEWVEMGKNKKKATLALELGLYNAKNPNITSIIYNKNYQKKDFVLFATAKHYDLNISFKKFSLDIRKHIIEIFTDIQNIPIKGKSAIILTEHFANLSIFSWEEQILLYQYLIDYFLSDYELVFKPHPDDLMYYDFLFPTAEILKGRFPSEILPYLFEEQPTLIATISSTAIHCLKESFTDCLEFNYDFSHYYKQFMNLHRYYVSLKIAELTSHRNIYIFGINSKIINNFSLYGGINIETITELETFFKVENEVGSVFLIDSYDPCNFISEQKMSDFMVSCNSNDLIIFINSNMNFDFFYLTHTYLYNYFYPVQISVNRLDNEKNYIPKEEYIYCFTKGTFNMEKSIEKLLTNSGVTIATKQEVGLKKENTILRGRLAATEKRLNYYISENNKLLTEQCEKGE